MKHKVVIALPKVRLTTSFASHSHGVTGGVYKARERNLLLLGNDAVDVVLNKEEHDRLNFG